MTVPIGGGLKGKDDCACSIYEPHGCGRSMEKEGGCVLKSQAILASCSKLHIKYLYEFVLGKMIRNVFVIVCPYQVLCHVHSNGRHLLVVLADHLLNDIGQVVILRLFDHVQQLLHDGPDVGSDVDLGCTQTQSMWLQEDLLNS